MDNAIDSTLSAPFSKNQKTLHSTEPRPADLFTTSQRINNAVTKTLPWSNLTTLHQVQSPMSFDAINRVRSGF